MLIKHEKQAISVLLQLLMHRYSGDFHLAAFQTSPSMLLLLLYILMSPTWDFKGQLQQQVKTPQEVPVWCQKTYTWIKRGTVIGQGQGERASLVAVVTIGVSLVRCQHADRRAPVASGFRPLLAHCTLLASGMVGLPTRLRSLRYPCTNILLK